jgi:hypothetical protein
MTKTLEVWSDSFKEGEWFLENLSTQFHLERVDRANRYNFQPVYTFYKDKIPLFVATVFGDYRGWDPVPVVIKKILDYGKPDVILYDRAKDRVFFAVEETAAVPTGNQSLQRLERVCFSAEQRIPFIYLISEYGLHKDGGVRRTSIWPSYLALKLSSQYRVPSLTLLYSDAEHPEDYSIGTGVGDLSAISYLFIQEWLGFDVKAKKKDIFSKVIRQMVEFISDQADEISPHLPGRSILTSKEVLDFIIKRIAEI